MGKPFDHWKDFRKTTALSMSIVATADLVIHPKEYENDKKGYYSSGIQFAAGLGFSKNDLPTALKEKLEQWIGSVPGSQSQDGNAKPEKKTRKRTSEGDAAPSKRKKVSDPSDAKGQGQGRKRKSK